VRLETVAVAALAGEAATTEPTWVRIVSAAAPPTTAALAIAARENLPAREDVGVREQLVAPGEGRVRLMVTIVMTSWVRFAEQTARLVE
jgi:hypothetical protein